MPLELTRSRVELAIGMVIYAIANEVLLEIPPSFFRSDEERRIAESLTAADTFAATAAVMDAFGKVARRRARVSRDVLNFADAMRADFAYRARFDASHGSTPTACVPRTRARAPRPARRRRLARARSPSRRSSCADPSEPEPDDHHVARESGRVSVLRGQA